jgi:hypothetical protein
VWSEQGKLLAIDGASDNEFGFSVALSGDTVLIGAWGEGGYKQGRGYKIKDRKWTTKRGTREGGHLLEPSNPANWTMAKFNKPQNRNAQQSE